MADDNNCNTENNTFYINIKDFDKTLSEKVNRILSKSNTINVIQNDCNQITESISKLIGDIKILKKALKVLVCNIQETNEYKKRRKTTYGSTLSTSNIPDELLGYIQNTIDDSEEEIITTKATKEKIDTSIRNDRSKSTPNKSIPTKASPYRTNDADDDNNRDIHISKISKVNSKLESVRDTSRNSDKNTKPSSEETILSTSKLATDNQVSQILKNYKPTQKTQKTYSYSKPYNKTYPNKYSSNSNDNKTNYLDDYLNYDI